MAVNLSPLAIGQLELSNGEPAVGGLLFFYVAGAIGTKSNTYTDYTGITANTNPVVLNSLGMPTTSGTPTEIWFTAGQAYDIVYAPAGDTDPPSSPIRTFHSWRGINDTTVSVDQWVAFGGAPTFVSATSFTLSGDQTSTFQIGRRVKTTNSGGTIYSTITNSVFGALTTVTVVNDSGVLDSGLSAVSYGLLSPLNPSVPSTYAKSGANADITSASALATVSTAGTVTFSGAGGVALSGGDLSVLRSNVGSAVSSTITNSDNTNGASHATQSIISGGASGGDARTLYGITGVVNWVQGIDNSDSDKFKISAGTALGTGDAFSIDASGNVWIGAGQTVATADSPVYSSTTARAWVKFTSVTSTAITDSLNVTSLTDNGAGDTTINFTNAMPSANYTWGGACQTTGLYLNAEGNVPTTTALRVVSKATTSGAATDGISMVMVVGG